MKIETADGCAHSADLGRVYELIPRGEREKVSSYSYAYTHAHARGASILCH